jgi:FkbM family methyltransferase
MTPKTVLPIAGGSKVVVPDSLDLITTYVVREQEDWFEDEIKFLRILLKPGQKVIDIGANYGLYTLSMANAIGSEGRLWAFEPGSSTAAYLKESLVVNRIEMVVLDQRALSEQAGTARLSLNANAELNELVRDGGDGRLTEEVALTSLDEAQQYYGWSDIDFIKIDAEGEEAAIIKGGRRFLEKNSPLIQYEIKAGAAYHLDLVRLFSDIGYLSYRLIPGLNVLVPFNPNETIDPFLLNLFCCKADRAAKLATEGYLVLDDAEWRNPDSSDTAAVLAQRLGVEAHGWRSYLLRLPYGRMLSDVWQTSGRGQQFAAIEKAIALHSIANDKREDTVIRVMALRSCFNILSECVRQEPSGFRRMTLARVAGDYGMRGIGVSALTALIQEIQTTNQLDFSEPFLAASERFDLIDPKGQVSNWIFAGLLETYERKSSFSSYYTGNSALQRLEVMGQLGYASPEMERRLGLVKQRFGIQK